MVNKGLIYVLLILNGASLVTAIASLVIVILVLKKQKEVLHMCATKLVSNQVAASQQRKDARHSSVQDKVESTPTYGLIICKRCYAAIPDTATACSFCKASVGRR